MRILIITHERSGGQSLSKWLAKELNYELIHEPYHPIHCSMEHLENSYKLDNIVVKMLIGELKYCQLNLDILCNSFNKVISLIREDSVSSAISRTFSSLNDMWADEYEINSEWIGDNVYEIVRGYNSIENQKEQLIKLPVFQVKYENIYQNTDDIKRIKSYLLLGETEFEEKFLSPNKRYRNNKTNEEDKKTI